MSSTQALYKGVMMDHYHAPRNQGDLPGADSTARLDNPLCGDEIEVAVRHRDGAIEEIRFRARGCAICIASGSMMTETAQGRSALQARALAELMSAWFAGDERDPPAGLPETLAALTPVRDYPTRARCVTLAWEALTAALARIDPENAG